jgi:eukaryotic-like serine/threonine-protein kinase
MASVWLAEGGDAALKRKVALKIPYLMAPDGMLAERFARERDILAQLSDPRIARLYDAGVAQSGQPYLVLEHVEGVPITNYCDQQLLPLAGRLRLFLQVLRAVQYAHNNLIVHRDLKPANILVKADGEVKVLDFGIAKLLTDGDGKETELTRLGGRSLTLDYASPEQVLGNVITTASDVYSIHIPPGMTGWHAS